MIKEREGGREWEWREGGDGRTRGEGEREDEGKKETIH